MYRIRELREDSDFSQKQISEVLKVHQTTYSDYEIGNLNPSIHVLCKLADFYKCSIDYLVGRTDQKEPYPKSNRKRD